MLSNNEEYKKKVIENIINVYNQDMLDKKHINFLNKLKENGFNPKVFYDIGSSTLHYTRHVENIWPNLNNSNIILFDAFEPLKFLYDKFEYKYHIEVLSDENNKQIKWTQYTYR